MSRTISSKPAKQSNHSILILALPFHHFLEQQEIQKQQELAILVVQNHHLQELQEILAQMVLDRHFLFCHLILLNTVGKEQLSS